MIYHHIIGRHSSTSKEVFRHPSVRILEMIWHALMTENIYEQKSVVIMRFILRTQPGGDLRQEGLIILHVLQSLITNVRC